MKTEHTRRHQDAVDIFQAGLQAVAPGEAIKRYCRLKGETLLVDSQAYDLGRFEKIFVCGAGKAGAAMARAVEEILGARITSGVVTVKYGHLEDLERIRIQEAGHPVPDQNGFEGARMIYRLAEAADEKNPGHLPDFRWRIGTVAVSGRRRHP